ncbi:hypothetical protein [Qipengyuania psychrotolerans]|uniref:Uncharacterized protein n=1 Tax=Qipengyuania psychrotolerans TaxID=2867238 RepID=A0ABX8ZEQ7_9SPHN|nr:hypothetical protein [Qipengyuania psychrotolerans]QZD87443.1 hypothetical protein K3166_01645 [Qipengyuania psychrotolerans]
MAILKNGSFNDKICLLLPPHGIVLAIEGSIMRKIRKPGRIAIALVTIATAFVPVTAFGQSSPEARSSANPSYHLKQLSVATAGIPLEEFKTKTEAIRSCLDANKLAKELDADVKTDRFVPSWDLSDDLRDALRDVPTGHATEVFSNDPSVMRVLVICHRL